VNSLSDQSASAEVERLRALWKDQALITALFEAHTRGDVQAVLKSAFDEHRDA
jgi:hypothetical protein